MSAPIGNKLTDREWDDMEKLYSKLSDPCCPECMEEADALLRILTPLFDYRDLRLILQERSRIVALALGREESSIRMKKVLKPVYVRMGVLLPW